MIVTFYSYKGGVGRTMALANVGVALADMGASVLTIDFDLEAPGLSRYYQQLTDVRLDEQEGVLDLLVRQIAKSRSAKPPAAYPVTLDVTGSGKLDLLTSGRQNEAYVGQVLEFDWRRFFEGGGGEVFEEMRTEWSEQYDFVLIDSRTGITDIGGICTIQLPDVIVPVVTASDQSLRGAVEVMNRAQAGRRRLVRSRGEALLFPVVSRFDDRTEHELAQTWVSTFSKDLAHFFEPWLPTKFEARQMIERTKLPYVSFYSFGEELPVRRDSPSDLSSLGFALRSVALLLRDNFGNVGDMLADPTPDSSSLPTAVVERVVSGLESDLRRRGINVLTRLVNVGVGEEASDRPGEGVAADLLNDDFVIDLLVREQVLTQHGKTVHFAHPSMASSRSIQKAIELHPDLLWWSSELRARSAERLDFVPSGDLLTEGLRWMAIDASLLTPFELDMVRLGRTALFAGKRRLDLDGMVFATFVGAAIGAAAGSAASAVTESPLDSYTVLSVGAGIGAYVGGLGSVLHHRRLRRVIVDTGLNPCPNARRIVAVELARLGYRARGSSEVVSFDLVDRRLAIGGGLDRLFSRRVADADYSVLIRPSEGGTLEAEGPIIVLRRLMRGLRRQGGSESLESPT